MRPRHALEIWRLAKPLTRCSPPKRWRASPQQGLPEERAQLNSTTAFDIPGISKSCAETCCCGTPLTFVVALDLVDGSKGPKLALEFKLADVC